MSAEKHEVVISFPNPDAPEDGGRITARVDEADFDGYDDDETSAKAHDLAEKLLAYLKPDSGVTVEVIEWQRAE